MARIFNDWLPAFVNYASVTEAPRRMHFWSGVSAIAGAIRKHAWIDMGMFIWSPCFYIVFVAPPGIVSKSTTADLALELLREVPGIKFGPDAITWQALVTSFAAASEAFEWEGEWRPMSPLTLVATELGNLINMQDREMLTLLITLWDGRKRYTKETKMSGNDVIEAPWINMIACTTPHWISDNMPPSMIGGGLSSRCIFVYADQKEKFVANPKKHMKVDAYETRAGLIQDLEHIANNIVGPFELSSEADAWSEEWYERFWKDALSRMNDEMLQGYAARKQTHLYKLALIISASRGDSRVIEVEDIQLANVMLEQVEQDMHKVFSRIGRTEDSLQAEKLVAYLRKEKEVSYEKAYRMVHVAFPDFRNFEGILDGLIRSGQVTLGNNTEGPTIRAMGL